MPDSWSGIRKRLEQNLLCEKLRGRVRYFLTHYHGAPDQYGRFCLRLDGKEIIFAHPYNDMAVSRTAERVKRELEEGRNWLQLFDGDRERYDAIFRLANQRCIENNTMEIYHITDALKTYLQAPVQASVQSENPAVRMFAILDRRIGKRTLSRLAPAVEKQPDWLKPLYRVRLEAEGIPAAERTGKAMPGERQSASAEERQKAVPEERQSAIPEGI